MILSFQSIAEFHAIARSNHLLRTRDYYLVPADPRVYSSGGLGKESSGRQTCNSLGSILLVPSRIYMTAYPLALPCIIEPCSAFTRALRSFDDPSLSSIALGYQTVEEIAEHRARGGTILLSQLTTFFSCYFNTHLDNTFGQFVDLMWSVVTRPHSDV